MNRFLCATLLLFSCALRGSEITEINAADQSETVTIALLFRNRPATVPLYISSIENQTFPKDRIRLYVYINDKKWDFVPMLEEWLTQIKPLYLDVHVDYGDEEERAHWNDAETWGSRRFAVWSNVRQRSLDWACLHHSHYFVVDDSHFILPSTLEVLLKADKPVIAPLLRTGGAATWSNYHSCIDPHGYYADCPHYYLLVHQTVKGLIPVPVVNGTYLVRQNVAPKLFYDDGSAHHEYVKFSRIARKNGIEQILDNREIYGHITRADTAQKLAQEPWVNKFLGHRSPSPMINKQLTYLSLLANRDSTEIFTDIYNRKEQAGISDPGSTLESTQNYRHILQNFLRDNKINSVVDLGCGIWEFLSHIDWNGIEYRGFDVVARVIEQNKLFYENDHIHFEQLDALQHELPAADLLLCKDVLQHLTNEDIQSIIAQFKKYKYCLITNGLSPLDQLNHPIKRGDYRPIDLTKPPFSLEGIKILTYTVWTGNSGINCQTLLMVNKDYAHDVRIHGLPRADIFINLATR